MDKAWERVWKPERLWDSHFQSEQNSFTILGSQWLNGVISSTADTGRELIGWECLYSNRNTEMNIFSTLT